MKRYISFFLSICLVVGLLPINIAFASNDTTKVQIISGGHWNFQGIDNGSTIKVTFNNNGFNTALRVDNGGNETITTTCKGDSLYTSTQNDKITVRTDVATISNDRYVQLKYSIKNNDTIPHTVSIATHADIQIGSNDSAAITYNAATHALEMTNGTYTFRIFVSDTYGVSDIDTYWVGRYSERTNHLWDTNKVGSCSGVDSGVTFGWLNRTIQPGQTLSLANAGGVGGLNTPPKITSCNIVDKKSFYWPGDLIKFSANVTDTEKDPITVKWVLDNGADESATVIGTYSYPYSTVNHQLNLPSATQGMSAGEHTLKIVAMDSIGDSATYSVPFTVYQDSTAPTINSAKQNTDAWAKSKNIVITATDGPADVNKRSGIKSITLKQGNTQKGIYNVPAASNKGEVSYTFNNIAVGTYTVEVLDNFGNKSSTSVTVNNIDTTAPGTNLNISGVQNKWLKEITIPSGTYTDSQSGVKKLEYLVNGTLQKTEALPSPLASYNSQALKLTNLHNGKDNKLIVKRYDDVGNVAETTYDNLWVDNETPQITSTKQNSGGKYVYEDSISITATDNYSGINKFYYAITDSETCPTPDLTTGVGEVKNTYTRENLKITTPGTNYVHVWTEDLVGNRYNKHFGPFYIDRVGPSIKVDKTSSPWNDSFSINTKSEAAEGSLSGIKSISYKIVKVPTEAPPTDKPTTDAGFTVVNTNAAPLQFDTQINIPNETGIYYVYLISENNAGVKSSIIERGPYKIDKDYPTINSSIEKQEQWKNSIPVSLTLKDQTSNISYAYTITDNANTPEFSEFTEVNDLQHIENLNVAEKVNETGIYYIHIKIKDVAGHETTSCFGPFYVDLDAPHIAIDREKQESWSKEPEGLPLTVTMTDDTSEIDVYGYKVTDTADEVDFNIDKAGNVENIKITDNGKKYLHFGVKDTAGNITKQTYGPYWFDNTLPEISTDITETDTYAQSIDLTFAIKDTVSGLQYWEYAVTNFSDDNPEFISGNEIQDGLNETRKTVSYSVDNAVENETEGQKAVYIKLVDIAGNVHTEKFGPYMVDTSKPTIEDYLKESDEYIRYVVDLNMADIGSGIVKYGYQIDMEKTSDSIDINSTLDSLNEATIPVTIRKMEQNGTGNYYIHVQVIDATGNESKIYTFGPYVIDNTIPEAKITAPDGWQTEDFDVNLKVTDNMLIADGLYKINDDSIENLEYVDDKHYEKDITIDEDGIYEIKLKAIDGGENEKVVTKTVYLDKTPPEISDDWYDVYIDSKELASGSIGDHVHIKDIAYIRVMANDAMSGISRFEYKVVNNENPTVKEGTVLTDENGTSYYFVLHTSIDGEISPEDYIEVTFYDKAGNSSTEIINDVVMDDVPPSINYGDRGLPDWINSTTKEALEELEGKENIDVDIYVADNMTVHGTAWKTLSADNEDNSWDELPTQENPDEGIGENAIESGDIENSKIYIDPDRYSDGYYRIYVKAWDHTFNKNVNFLDFKVDKTPCVFDVATPENSWYNTPIDLDINIKDELSGIDTVEIYTANSPDREEAGIYEMYTVDDNEFELTYTIDIDGEYDVFITAVDIAGNEKTIVRHIKLDQQTEWEAPLVEFINGDDMDQEYTVGEWSNTPVIAKYKYSEPLPVSGFKNYTHGVNDTVYDISADTEIFDKDEVSTFRVRAITNANLISDVSPDNVDINDGKQGYEIMVDRTKPFISKIMVDGKVLEANTYFNHNIDLEVYASDNLSGVRDYYYRFDYETDWNLLDGNIAHIGSDMEYSGGIHFKVVDNADNESYEVTIDNFNIDTTKPSLSYKECNGSELILQSTEPITKYINGYFRFNDRETGKFVKTIYMNNNRIRVEGDLVYVNIANIVVPGKYNLTIDKDIFFDRAGNMNNETSLRIEVNEGQTPEFIGAIAVLPNGFEIKAVLNKAGNAYHVTLPTNTTEFIMKPLYSNSSLAGIITSSYGELDENRYVSLNTQNLQNNEVDFSMGGKTDRVKVVLFNYSIDTVVGDGLRAAIDTSQIEQAIDIYDLINNSITDVQIKLSIAKANEENADIKKEIELAQKVELSKEQQLSYPIDISIIQSVNGEETKLHHLQNDITISLQIPYELRDRQWYKIIRIHDGDVDVLETTENEDTVTFNSYRFSTYFILAGPENYHPEEIKHSNPRKLIPNWNFVVPYYENDKIKIEPFSISTAKGSATPKIQYLGSKDANLLYNEVEFNDVPKGYWAKDSVDFLAARNIMNGVPGGLFDGDRVITRAEVAAILVRLSGAQPTYSGYFYDVDNDFWASGYIGAACDLGLTTGIGDGYFAPNREITKEELAVMLYRYMGSPEIKDEEISVPLKDIGDISPWALDAAKYLTSVKIIQGNDFREFQPKENSTRYVTAEMIRKFVEYTVRNSNEVQTIRVYNTDTIEDV